MIYFVPSNLVSLRYYNSVYVLKFLNVLNHSGLRTLTFNFFVEDITGFYVVVLKFTPSSKRMSVLNSTSSTSFLELFINLFKNSLRII